MEPTLLIAFVAPALVLWFWAIIDVTKSKFKNRNMKVVWLLVVLFFPFLGSILYFQLTKHFLKEGSRKFQPNFNRIS